MPTCLNLKERFGADYRIRREEGATIGDPWGLLIPCRFGHIYPWGGDRLAASIDGHKGIQRRMNALPFAEVWQDGDFGEGTVLFDVSHFAEVAKIMRPKRRMYLSPERKAAAIERLARINAERRQSDQETALDCVPRPQGDPKAVPEQEAPFSSP
jgi:hypothetical protein